MMFSASAHLSPSPTPRNCMKLGYFLALQEPAPQLASPGFFFPAGVAAGLAPGPGAAPGLAAVVAVDEEGDEGDAGAGLAIVGAEGAAGAAAGDGVAGVEVSAAGVIGAAGGGVAAVGDAGVLGSGFEPPQAATPSAAAANPKILFLSVISIAILQVFFE